MKNSSRFQRIISLGGVIYMGKHKKSKTNALRILDSKGVNYKTQSYEAPDGFLDGVSVALQVGINPDCVFKTLVLQGTSREYYVCVIPVAKELDLKKVASHFGEKKVEMIPAKNITKVTGYIKGGCSPIGMKKLYKTALAKEAEQLGNITVSAGRVGLQVIFPVKDLMEITNATFGDLTIED